MSPVLRRLLAVAAAAVMVVGAAAARHRINVHTTETTAQLSLECATELADVCTRLQQAAGSRLQVHTGPPGALADALSSSTTEAVRFDGWLVPAPWPAIVNDARRRSGQPAALRTASAPLAHSPLVLVMWTERARVLAARCPNAAITWKCVGDNAGTAWGAIGGQTAWGPIKPGHADAAATGEGLLALGQATASYFGRPDLSAADLEDDGYQSWLARLERAIPNFTPAGDTPLQAMAVQGPSAYDVVGTTEAEAKPLLAVSARRDLQLLASPPDADLAVVLVAPTGARHADVLRKLVTGSKGRDAFTATGWRAGAPPAAHRGEPDAGTLAALRAEWRRVTGR
jgi:hypothetical protein